LLTKAHNSGVCGLFIWAGNKILRFIFQPVKVHSIHFVYRISMILVQISPKIEKNQEEFKIADSLFL